MIDWPRAINGFVGALLIGLGLAGAAVFVLGLATLVEIVGNAT